MLKIFKWSNYQKKIFTITILILSITIFIPQKATAKTFMVESYQKLLVALNESAHNKEDDIIKVSAGVDIPATNDFIETGFSLTIKSGYSNNFNFRSAVTPTVDTTVTKGGFPQIPAQSTSGPVPPEGVEPASKVDKFFDKEVGATEKVLGVPGYLWRHGCGPTALGMIIGYYDLIGFSSLYKGSAATQTSDVDQGIASERSSSDPGHYEDYSLPMDTYSDNPIPDKSEAPAGDEHTSDCVADFMQTSFSSRDNFYGWSWSNDISPAFLKYVQYKNPSYIAESSTYYMSNNSLNWNFLKQEIDNNRPMVFLVDSSGNGYTDHFVAVVGYREGTELEYGCLDTWEPASTVRWCTFTGMALGHKWGIWGGWSFSLTGKTKSIVPQNMLLLQ